MGLPRLRDFEMEGACGEIKAEMGMDVDADFCDIMLPRLDPGRCLWLTLLYRTLPEDPPRRDDWVGVRESRDEGRTAAGDDDDPDPWTG